MTPASLPRAVDTRLSLRESNPWPPACHAGALPPAPQARWVSRVPKHSGISSVGLNPVLVKVTIRDGPSRALDGFGGLSWFLKRRVIDYNSSKRYAARAAGGLSGVIGRLDGRCQAGHDGQGRFTMARAKRAAGAVARQPSAAYRPMTRAGQYTTQLRLTNLGGPHAVCASFLPSHARLAGEQASQDGDSIRAR